MNVQEAVLTPEQRGVVSLALLALLAVAIVSSAAATPGTPVSINNTVTSFDPGVLSDFASTGGVVCASGTVTTQFERFVGWQSNLQSQIRVGKRFACAPSRIGGMHVALGLVALHGGKSVDVA